MYVLFHSSQKQIATLLVGLAIGGLSFVSNSFGDDFQQQESERLAGERQWVDQEGAALASMRTFLDREKAYVQQTYNRLSANTDIVIAKKKQIDAYLQNWRCPDGCRLSECSAHPSSVRAAVAYYSSQFAALQMANDSIQREVRALNVRRSQFQERVNNFNYRINVCNSRSNRLNEDLADYNRRYAPGYGAVSGGNAGSAGNTLTFDESVPRK